MTMDYPIKLSTVLFLLLATEVVCQDLNLTNPYQFGAMYCNVVNNIMNVTISVLRNGSEITGAEFFNISDSNTKFDTGDCQFTGNGSDSNPFRAYLQIDMTTNMPPSGRTYCGHYLVPNSSPKQFLWAVDAYKQKGFNQYGDEYIYYNCSSDNSLPTIIYQNVKVLLDIEKNLTQNNGLIQFDLISIAGTTITQIPIGDLMRLRLQFSPSAFDNTDASNPDLRPWGAYCKELYATPSLTSTRRIHLQDSNGCPRADMEFLRPETNFAQDTTNSGYLALTGNITSARFDKSVDNPFEVVSGRVYFVCIAEICWRESDNRCKQRCQTSGRRKRQDLDETYTLVTYVDVIDVEKEVTEKDTNTSESLPIEFIIGISVGGILLIIALMALVIYLIMRRPGSRDNYVKYGDSSSASSTISGRSYPDISKMQNKHYRY